MLKQIHIEAPKWLRNQVKNFLDFADKRRHQFPTDVAMAMYLSEKYPKDEFKCFNGLEVSVKELDEYDVVFNIYDAIEIFHHLPKGKTSPDKSKRFESILTRTKAIVYPFPEFHKYIIVKPTYYADLKKNGIPVVDFLKAVPKNIVSNPDRFISAIHEKNWKGIIVKPSYSGYSIGIKVFKNISSTNAETIIKHFEYLDKKGFPSATVQEYIPSFRKHYEIRTYWLDGKYLHAIGTGLEDKYDETFISEGGAIPESVKRGLITIGKKVLSSIMQFPVQHPLIRIDFGCCLKTDDCEETYFVNEVETCAANMLDAEGREIVEEAAESFYRFAKKIKKLGKKRSSRSKKKSVKKSVKKSRNKKQMCPVYEP